MRLGHFRAVDERLDVVALTAHFHVGPALRIDGFGIRTRDIINGAAGVYVERTLIELDFEAMERGPRDHGVSGIADENAAVEDAGPGFELQAQDVIAVVVFGHQPPCAAVRRGPARDNDSLFHGPASARVDLLPSGQIATVE